MDFYFTSWSEANSIGVVQSVQISVAAVSIVVLYDIMRYLATTIKCTFDSVPQLICGLMENNLNDMGDAKLSCSLAEGKTLLGSTISFGDIETIQQLPSH